MKQVFKVSVKMGGYYLIPAVNREKAEERARAVGAKRITGVERHQPKPWPDQDILRAELKRSETGRRVLGTRRIVRGKPHAA